MGLQAAWKRILKILVFGQMVGSTVYISRKICSFSAKVDFYENSLLGSPGHADRGKMTAASWRTFDKKSARDTTLVQDHIFLVQDHIFQENIDFGRKNQLFTGGSV